MLASHRHAPKRVEALMSSLTASFGEVHRLNSGSAVKFVMSSRVLQMSTRGHHPAASGMLPPVTRWCVQLADQ